jgi:hypothetical protein
MGAQKGGKRRWVAHLRHEAKRAMTKDEDDDTFWENQRSGSEFSIKI